MAESGRITRRYLLGEMSESEQSAFEKKYFTDSRVFDQVLKTENELVNNYVRGRLSPQTREQFEQSYLNDPKRRERVKFAEALADRLDQVEGARVVAARSGADASRWQRLLVSLRRQRPMFGFAISFVFLLITVVGILFVIENRRLRQESAQTQTAQAEHARREREQQQLADEHRQANEVAGEVSRPGGVAVEPEPTRAPPQTAQAKQTPPLRVAPTVASLVLTVGGVRGADASQTPHLVIPPGTTQVRLRLNLKDNDYPSYRAVLRAVGGAEVFSRQGLKPTNTKSGAGFIFVLPARELAAGDYILTLAGVNQDGEIDDVSKSIFRVGKE
jgi:hypothetical protein